MKKEEKTSPEQFLSFVVFRIGEELFGINIFQVKEITNMAEISSLPNPPPFISGLIDLRGTLIPILDVRKKLGFPVFNPTKRARILIVSIKGRLAGFVADEVKDVVRIEKEKVKTPPLLLRESGADIFQGIFKIDSKVVFVLDMERLFTEKEIMDMKKISEIIKERG
jgi:purine-binding chemotaxis protein CheW